MNQKAQKLSVYVGHTADAKKIVDQLTKRLGPAAADYVVQGADEPIDLEGIMNRAPPDFAVLAVTPEEFGPGSPTRAKRSKPGRRARRRPGGPTPPSYNLLFRLGLFMGMLGRHRTFRFHRHLDDESVLPLDLRGVRPVTFAAAGDVSSVIGPACDTLARYFLDNATAESMPQRLNRSQRCMEIAEALAFWCFARGKIWPLAFRTFQDHMELSMPRVKLGGGSVGTGGGSVLDETSGSTLESSLGVILSDLADCRGRAERLRTDTNRRRRAEDWVLSITRKVVGVARPDRRPRRRQAGQAPRRPSEVLRGIYEELTGALDEAGKETERLTLDLIQLPAA